ncbi:MAG: C1 family peptidase, partial [Meiothermus sp.]|nr:C1 family peptidase [Meiothermus sp.]
MNSMQKLLGISILALAACSPTPQSPTGAIGDKLLTVENAFSGETEGAQQVSPEEFRRRVGAGELTLVSDAIRAAQNDSRMKQHQNDRNFLRSLSNKSAYLEDLLSQADQSPDYQPDALVTLPDGQKVTLLGVSSQMRDAVVRQQLAQSTENALADYALSYALLPEAMQSQAAAPESLKGKPLEEIKAALAQLNALLETDPSALRTARLEASPTGPGISGRVSAQDLTPKAGNGTDNNGPCAAPSNFFSRYWFPLKNFISPVKNQSVRGTCWAFSAIGAVESRLRVQDDIRIDLSEQFLVNKYKREWYPDDFGEGGGSEAALAKLVDTNQALPPESFWTYNPSTIRTSTGSSYFFSCFAASGFYSGTCSNSAHQSQQVCTVTQTPQGKLSYCAYEKMTFSGAGARASKAVQIWANGQSFDLNRYIRYLATGHTIIASFPVYRGFDEAPTSGANAGVVSDYSMTFRNAAGQYVSGSRGNHVAQIVGFLSNWDMRREATTPNIGGGGYFILKNSWGCTAGDGGYYYIPANYVSQLFSDMSVLDFDSRRSTAWSREQANPATDESPVFKIPANPVQVIQNLETDLAKFFQVVHRFTSSVNLTVTSSVDGSLYSGPFNTANVTPSTLNRTFRTPGPRTLTLTARYGSTQAQASLAVNVLAPPANPYPVITSARVVSSELIGS